MRRINGKHHNVGRLALAVFEFVRAEAMRPFVLFGALLMVAANRARHVGNIQPLGDVVMWRIRSF